MKRKLLRRKPRQSKKRRVRIKTVRRVSLNYELPHGVTDPEDDMRF